MNRLSDEPDDLDRLDAEQDVPAADAFVLVPAENSLRIDLPALPRSRAHLREMIARQAPLLPDELAWTAPTRDADGAHWIVVAQKRWLDQEIGRAERERGQPVEARSAIDGRAFDYRTPWSTREYRRTLIAWLVALSVLFAVAITRSDEPIPASVQSEAPAEPIDPVFARPTLAATLLALTPLLTPDVAIASIARERQGTTIVELLTPDPDALRSDAALRDRIAPFRETGQTRDAGGGYRVRFERGEMRGAATSGTVPPIPAEDARAALAQAQQVLATQAAAHVIQMSQTPTTSGTGGAVEFGATFVGPQKDVLAFADRIESGALPIRFAEWTLTGEGAGVRLSTLVVVAWSVPR